MYKRRSTPTARILRQRELAELCDNELLARAVEARACLCRDLSKSDKQILKENEAGELTFGFEISSNSRNAARRKVIELIDAHDIALQADQFETTLTSAINSYYGWWLENRYLLKTGYGDKGTANRLHSKLSEANDLLKSPELLNRLIKGADIVWPSEPYAARQCPPFNVDDFDAFYKSPHAFIYALQRFCLITAAATFKATTEKLHASDDLALLAQIFFNFYRDNVDADAGFWTYTDNEAAATEFDNWAEEEDPAIGVAQDPRKSSKAFEFVFAAIQLIDVTVTRSNLKDFAPCKPASGEIEKAVGRNSFPSSRLARDHDSTSVMILSHAEKLEAVKKLPPEFLKMRLSMAVKAASWTGDKPETRYTKRRRKSR